MEIILLAKSSSGDSYPVHFRAAATGVTAFCTCQAGVNRMLCKHVRALIEGDQRMLYDPAQAAHLSEVARWCEDSGMLTILAQLDELLGQIATAKKDLDRQAAELKRSVVDHLHAGFGSVEFEEDSEPSEG
jgi:hypothetical protein